MSVATPNFPVAVSLPERSAGWRHCSTWLAAVTPVEGVALESQVQCMLETDQVHPPPPPPVRMQVSIPQKCKTRPITDRAGIRILVFVTIVVLSALVVLLQHLPHLLTSPREFLIIFIVAIFKQVILRDRLRFPVFLLYPLLRSLRQQPEITAVERKHL